MGMDEDFFNSYMKKDVQEFERQKKEKRKKRLIWVCKYILPILGILALAGIIAIVVCCA